MVRGTAKPAQRGLDGVGGEVMKEVCFLAH